MLKRQDRFIQPEDGIVFETHPAVPHRGLGVDSIPPTDVLTRHEVALIVRKIGPFFDETADRFDEVKYPLDVYERVLNAFARPSNVSPGTLRDALLWKYGHLSKEGRIPGAHKKLIGEIQRAWPRLARTLPQVPGEAFAALNAACGGRTRFITVAFLIHLTFQQSIPIIDQHNYRAVNSLIRDVRPAWRSKTKRPDGRTLCSSRPL